MDFNDYLGNRSPRERVDHCVYDCIVEINSLIPPEYNWTLIPEIVHYVKTARTVQRMRRQVFDHLSMDIEFYGHFIGDEAEELRKLQEMDGEEESRTFTDALATALEEIQQELYYVAEEF
ncbi:MAG: hypothetical protein ABIE22_02360 [archaeon]